MPKIIVDLTEAELTALSAMLSNTPKEKTLIRTALGEITSNQNIYDSRTL
jgi:hypothetical protein